MAGRHPEGDSMTCRALPPLSGENEGLMTEPHGFGYEGRPRAQGQLRKMLHGFPLRHLAALGDLLPQYSGIQRQGHNPQAPVLCPYVYVAAAEHGASGTGSGPRVCSLEAQG